MTAVGATAVGVTEVRNNLELEMIINIGSTIILRMILILRDRSFAFLGAAGPKHTNTQTNKQICEQIDTNGQEAG